MLPSLDGVLLIEEHQGSFLRRGNCSKLYLSTFVGLWGMGGGGEERGGGVKDFNQTGPTAYFFFIGSRNVTQTTKTMWMHQKDNAS